MTLADYLSHVKTAPKTLEFSELMAVIEAHYDFTPTAFRNGRVENGAEQNQGSCKLFAFAKLHGLSAAQTLACFGAYYREDVLQNPQGEDHQNIRNFIVNGWDGIAFDGEALRLKG